MALLIVILGGMYFGIVTPTEAAAFGCFGAALLALVYREARWSDLRHALRNAIVTNAVVMFIIINSQILSFAFTTTRARTAGGDGAGRHGLRAVRLSSAC